MAGFDIDYERYAEISDSISFSPDVCSDGLCCFLTPDHFQSHHLRQDFSMGLVDAKKPVKAKNLEEFLKNFFMKNISEDKACSHLNLDYSVKEGKLYLQFRCRMHDSLRPLECIEYPRNHMCKLHDHQKKHREEERYFLYSFSKMHFPDLEEFSCGRMTNVLEGEFFLVPVPLFSKVPKLFTPYDLALKKENTYSARHP